jgi:Holliday junction resolvase RusA-like endonuclease
MPWPRARARIAGTPGGKQWVQFYDDADAKGRKADVGALWSQLALTPEPRERPLELRVTFVFIRPGGHYGTGRNANIVKPACIHLRPGKGGGVTRDAAGRKHPTGGDLDNLIKLVKDGLTEAAYEDDGSVARVLGEKLYTDQAGVAEAQTVIEIWTIP